MQNQNVWSKFWAWLNNKATSESKSSYATSPPQGSEATFPYEYDSIGVQRGHVIMDVQDANGQWTTLDFEIDTGAYVTTLPASAASMLGLTLTQGTPSSLSGVDGRAFPVYTFKLNVRIAALGVIQGVPIAFTTLETPILAGWYGFLQRFREITFSNLAKEIMLQ